MPTTAGSMANATQELFGETPDTAIPRLIREFRTPYLVGVQLGVYANSVRNWLRRNGWVFKDGEWVAPDDAIEAQKT